MISPKTQNRILKIITDVSLSDIDDSKLDKALWELLSKKGCIDAGVKIINKNALNGKAIGDKLASILVHILESDIEYVDSIYEIFYNMSIGTENYNPKLQEYCEFMKLIYDLNNANTDSNIKNSIIEALSDKIKKIYPIPSKIAKVLSQAITESKNYILIMSVLNLLSYWLNILSQQSDHLVHRAFEQLNWLDIFKKISHESYNEELNNIMSLAISKLYFFDDAPLIEYSKRSDLKNVKKNLRDIEKYRTMLPNQWNILSNLDKQWSQPIYTFEDLKNFCTTLNEYLKSGYKLTTTLISKLDEVLQVSKFQDYTIDQITALVMNSNDTYDKIFYFTFEILSEKNFIKLLPFLIIKQCIDDQCIPDIHK